MRRKIPIVIFLFASFFSLPLEPVLAQQNSNAFSSGFVLKVMSLNVHALPLPNDSQSRLRDIGRILRDMRKQGTAPHVVALQEGFHSAINDLIKIAAYPYRQKGPAGKFPRFGSGLVILSEFPIVEKGSHAFSSSNAAGTDWFARKGVQYIKIQVPGLNIPLQIYNTHLQADYYDDAFIPLTLTRRVRKRQHLEIKKYFAAHTSASQPVVFPGDFNTTSLINDYPDIAAGTQLTDVAEYCALQRTCSGNADPLDDMRHSLDHQFYRPQSSYLLEPIYFEKLFTKPYKGRMLSDHDALLVHFLIR